VVLLSPRPGHVQRIIRTEIDRSKSPDEIRRDKNYLDYVDDIWAVLRTYL
jgi:NitT/TauT family transport system ATP-binding protein